MLDLIAAVDIACEDPLIVALFTKDGRYIGSLDSSGTALSEDERASLIASLKAYPTYIGPDARWWKDETDPF